MRPMCELRLWGKIRRCGLVVAGRASEDIQNRLSIRSVIDPQSQDTIRYGPPYEDTFVLVLPSRNLCQGLLQFVIECGMEYRIQCGKHFVCRCSALAACLEACRGTPVRRIRYGSWVLAMALTAS